MKKTMLQDVLKRYWTHNGIYGIYGMKAGMEKNEEILEFFSISATPSQFFLMSSKLQKLSDCDFNQSLAKN